MNLPYDKDKALLACEFCKTNTCGQVAVEAGFPIYRCRSCGLVQVRPLPESTADVNQSYWDVDLSNPNIGKSRWGSQRVYEFGISRIEAVSKHVLKGQKLLDVGCGMGMFLEMAIKHGVEPYGLDLTDEAVRFTKERCHVGSVYQGYFENCDLPENYFDVITAWGVLHHVRHPVEWLEKARALLADNGILLIKLPNVFFTSLMSRMYPVLRYFGMPKVNYLASRPPLNLYGFNFRTLRQVIETAGFDVREVCAAPMGERQGARRIIVNIVRMSVRILTLGLVRIDPVIMAVAVKRA